MKTPVVSTLKNRGSTTAKDGRMLNAFAEERNGVMRAVKRPAINPAFDNLGAGPGGGLFRRTTPDGDSVIVIVDDVLNTSPGPSVRSLSFSVQPDESDISVALTPAVVVQALNSVGQVAAGFNGTVVMSLSTNPTSATLGGTVSVAAVAGVATFSNLTINRSGEGFKLTATSSPLRSAVSEAFNIPTRCVFTDQPQSGPPNTTMTAVEVTVQDPGGNVDPNYSGDVSLEMFGTAGGVLSGTTTKTAVNGVATFSDLSVNQLGTYDFKATATEIETCYPPAAQFSASFQISNSNFLVATAGGAEVGWESTGTVFIGSSLAPTSYNEQAITRISVFVAPSDPQTDIRFSNTSLSQNFFTSVTVGAVTLLSADASYSNGLWQWNTRLFDAAGSYTVTFA